ncbi:MAG: hypothetical protein HFJ11_00110 [Bacilli bacterium]|nr:hypothetical protein [Bacilli bacterium]
MKKLPKLYKNEINKNINNNKNYCYLKNEVAIDSIEEKLNSIFNGIGYSYNIPVTIKTHDKIYKTSLVSKTKNNLITLDNEVIKLEDIISLDIN